MILNIIVVKITTASAKFDEKVEIRIKNKAKIKGININRVELNSTQIFLVNSGLLRINLL
jgi:hypothetical protein